MYPSSTSSSSQGSLGPNSSGGGGLTRYGSAPSSVFKTAVDSVIGNLQTPFSFRPSEVSASESSSKSNLNDHSYSRGSNKTETAIGLQRSYEFPSSTSAASSSSSLVRHSSSPAGFLNHLATAAADNGFSLTRGIGSSYNSKGIADNSLGISRLNSQLSFTHPKESLSRISEDQPQNIVADHNHGQTKSTHSYAAFGMTSWDDTTNTHSFSIGPPKRAKTVATHIVNDLDAMESQFQFGMPQASLEMSAMDKLLHIPQDSVPCKIRAKRGCATHPRSIAERERRTRISGKLKKLQDLVPNMDKQTSYSDMLDLAVQHIKVLQNQVQKLKKEVNDCTCGCNKNSDL